MPPDIEAEPLGRTTFCCLLPEGHALAAVPVVSFADLAVQTVISYRNATRPWAELDRAARAQGHGFAPKLEIDVSITAIGFVQAGLGVAVVDALLPWSQFQGVVVRPLDGAPEVPLSLLTAAHRPLSRAEEVMDHPVLHAITPGRQVVTAPDRDWACGTPHVLRAVAQLRQVAP